MHNRRSSPGEQTDGHLLAGRVRYAQRPDGHRSGIEPVLLAAAIPARPGERVLEGGSGAGAALLCLAARVAGLRGVGIERDPDLAALAAQNAAANGWSGLSFVATDVASLPALGAFDHACANPPWHSLAGTPSPDPTRLAAKHAEADLLATWATALAGPLRPRGTLTFVLPAAMLPAAVVAFAGAGCPPSAVLPLWAKPGQAAKLLLLRGVKGGRSPFRMLPGLTLHAPDGAFTAAAEAVLRAGGAIDL